MKLLHLSFLCILGYFIAVDAKIPKSYLHANKPQNIGDMILSPLQTRFLYGHSKQGRNAEIDVRKRWDNATVPYEFTSDFNEQHREKILSVLKREFSKTCVTFRPRKPTDKDYVLLVNEGGCFSYIGRIGGMQNLSLETHSKSSFRSADDGSQNSIFIYMESCITDRTIAHEFLHALGLFHQHSASNRDDYVSVQWNNISPESKVNFEKYEANRVSDFGEPYDYNSIMHYEEYAASYNGLATLIPKKGEGKGRIGQSKRLSESDINKINKMYNCKME